jgi:hypothetical protein
VSTDQLLTSFDWFKCGATLAMQLAQLMFVLKVYLFITNWDVFVKKKTALAAVFSIV